MIVQIYEIQTPQEAEKCIETGVDHIGSVLLSQNNWRIPSLKEVFLLSERTEIKNSLIPLFREVDSLYRAMDYYRPHYIHFCDSLSAREKGEAALDECVIFQSRLKEKFPEIKIIRSIPVPQKDISPDFPSLETAHVLEPVSDMFLIDTWLDKTPVQGYIGITGKTADWETAKELVLQSKIPVILAGGLSPENVYDALMKVLPVGADSCTMTNMMDRDGRPIRFKKDFRRVDEFVRMVRQAERAIHQKNESGNVKIAKKDPPDL